MVELQLDWPPRDERDRALGNYMDAWSRMETTLAFLLSDLLETDHERAFAVMAVVPTRQLVDLLFVLGTRTLNAEGQDRLKVVADKLMRRNLRRNRIVHGRWQANFILHEDGKYSGEWIRHYPVSDPRLITLNAHDPKLIGDYSFTIDALTYAAQRVDDLIELITSLREAMPGLRLQSQPPAESR